MGFSCATAVAGGFKRDEERTGEPAKRPSKFTNSGKSKQFVVDNKDEDTGPRHSYDFKVAFRTAPKLDEDGKPIYENPEKEKREEGKEGGERGGYQNSRKDNRKYNRDKGENFNMGGKNDDNQDDGFEVVTNKRKLKTKTLNSDSDSDGD